MSRRAASSSFASDKSHGEVASAELEVDPESRMCFCGLKAWTKTSKMEGNQGRRFFGYPRYSNSSPRHLACNFFEWIDPLHSAHEEDDIASMVRKMKIMDENIKGMEENIKVMEEKIKVMEEKIMEEVIHISNEKQRQLSFFLFGS